MAESVSLGVATLSRDENRLFIQIPNFRKAGGYWFYLIFFIFWTAAGTMAVWRSYVPLFEDVEPPFDTTGFIFWAIGFVFVGFQLLWYTFGKEEILVENGMLVVSRALFGARLSNEFRIEKISNLHYIGNASGANHAHSFLALTSGVLHFKYDGEAARFGSVINKETALEILRTCKANANFTDKNFS